MSGARAAVLSFSSLLDDETQEVEALRLNLDDIPRMPVTLEVEGLKPTLLSRLLDLCSPGSR
jgi:hypothetical protein